MTPSLTARFASAGLAGRAEQLSALAKSCIRLHRSRADDPLLPLGCSKIGGSPDVPESFEWPHWKGAPLAFLAQIRLSDLAHFETAARLPSAGMLSFFYDAEQQTWGFDPQDRGSWRVYYFSPEEALLRHSAPEPVPQHAIYAPCQVAFSEAVSVAPYDSAAIRRLRLSEDEAEAYFEVLDALAREQGEQPLHQLLGHPQPIQGDMQLECQLASNGLYCGDATGYRDPRRAALKPGAEQWQLLFQVDSDDDARMMWGDVGRLYFWIRREDLQRRNFDDVWMVLQCS